MLCGELMTAVGLAPGRKRSCCATYASLWEEKEVMTAAEHALALLDALEAAQRERDTYRAALDYYANQYLEAVTETRARAALEQGGGKP